jgi:hypothetical protein
MMNVTTRTGGKRRAFSALEDDVNDENASQ